MSKRKSYNPERKDWKGISYKTDKQVRDMKIEAPKIWYCTQCGFNSMFCQCEL